MEPFTLDPRLWPLLRTFRRNPLVRRSDRIEALIVMLALLLSLAALPVTAVVGATTYAASARAHEREMRAGHWVTATVEEAGATAMGLTVVQAKWEVAAGARAGTIELAGQVGKGDHVRIWLDNKGNPAESPGPAWLAAAEALGTASMTLLLVWSLLGIVVASVRFRLDRARDSAWERDLECLAQAP